MLPVGIGVSKLVVDFRLALRMGVPSAFRQGLDSDGEAAWVVGSIEDRVRVVVSIGGIAKPASRASAILHRWPSTAVGSVHWLIHDSSLMVPSGSGVIMVFFRSTFRIGPRNGRLSCNHHVEPPRRPHEGCRRRYRRYRWNLNLQWCGVSSPSSTARIARRPDRRWWPAARRQELPLHGAWTQPPDGACGTCWIGDECLHWSGSCCGRQKCSTASERSIGDSNSARTMGSGCARRSTSQIKGPTTTDPSRPDLLHGATAYIQHDEWTQRSCSAASHATAAARRWPDASGPLVRQLSSSCSAGTNDGPHSTKRSGRFNGNSSALSRAVQTASPVIRSSIRSQSSPDNSGTESVTRRPLRPLPAFADTNPRPMSG